MPFCGGFLLAGAELRCTYFSQRVENTLYFQGDDPWGLSELSDLADNLASWWSAEISSLVSDSLTLETISVRDLGAVDSYVYELNPSSGNVGGVTSPGLPGNVTMTVKFLTPFAGRAKRGRNFILGLAENRVTGNEVIAPYPANFVAAYEALNSYVVTANGAAHALLSKVTCDPEANDFGNVYVVTSYASDGVVDSQRRRLAGRGS